MKRSVPRVLALSSGGGHWVQLRRLLSAFEGAELVLATVYAADLAEYPEHRSYVLVDATRWDRLRILRSALRIVYILLRERPDVIFTTGALPGGLAIYIGKLIGARTIWLDSIANVEQLSMSGQRVGRVADLWLTQWPQLERPDGPCYAGSVL